jgi:hypothetical protein
VPARVAEPLLPPANMQVWRRVGIQSYMLLQMRLLAAAPITEAARTPAAV